MKIKYAIILSLVVIAVVAGIGLKMFFKPHADINKLKAEFKLDAGSLISEFETIIEMGEKSLGKSH